MSNPPNRWGARAAVARECLRALGAGIAMPFRAAVYLGRRQGLLAELGASLDAPAAIDEPGPARPPLERALRVFVSCAEPSGEIHAANLTRALCRELEGAGAPPPELSGLGGAGLRAAGVRTIGDPTARAAMGLDVLGSIPFYLRLLTDTAAHLRGERVDLCLLVDSPALHVPLAHIAKGSGSRVVHLATPQYWAWAPWRVGSYRRAVDLALTILPFEPAWFRERGVRVAHVGHPLLDELASPTPAGDPDSRVLALLPGSRRSVIRRNLPWMIAAAGRLRLSAGEVEVIVLNERSDMRETIEDCVRSAGASSWVRVEIGDLDRRLAGARAALSVSGTILIHLLEQRLPAVVVYRLGRALSVRLSHHLLSVPWFSSVNLLAGRELYPEFRFSGEGPIEEMALALERCYKEEGWRRSCVQGLDEAARRLGPPGATQRAARHALALLTRDPAPST